ncbi:hypothetical protein N0V88_007016 [Collariella sp. IMI 366227]|nr:hypothetical protein N0V88_007016 [Collariella sp. IMI 366227]
MASTRGFGQGRGKSTTLPCAPPSEGSSGSCPTSSAADPVRDCGWFLSAESWLLRQGSSAQGPISVSEETLPRAVSRLKEWAVAWARDGHSPLMHRQLHRGARPACIDNCLTSFAAYHAASHRRAKTTALRIMEGCVSRLVDTQPREDDLPFTGALSSVLLDSPAHLARTQALFVYQLVRLFDGDVRARAQAESHMETLTTWAKQMLDSSRLDCAAAEFLTVAADADASTDTAVDLPLPHIMTAGNHGPTAPYLQSEALFSPRTGSEIAIDWGDTPGNPFFLPANASIPAIWQAWIRAESVRRIYTASIYMQSTYNTLKQGWAVCPGMVAFTAQNGLWDARSAYSWWSTLRTGQRQYRGGAGGQRDGVSNTCVGGCGPLSPWVMVPSPDLRGMLQQATPEEVDDFAIAALEVSYGIESVEKWLFEKGSGTARQGSG